MQYLTAVSARRYDFPAIFSSDGNYSVKVSFSVCDRRSYCHLLRTDTMQRIKIYSHIYFAVLTTYSCSYRMIIMFLIVV